MNTTQKNNERHQEALDVVKNFKKQGGEVEEIKSDAIGNGWQAPIPRRLRDK